MIAIPAYFAEYSRKFKQSDSSIGHELVLYSSLLEHMLIDAGLIPTKKRPLKKCVRQLCLRKRILQIGCKSGVFLKFLQDHGAIVAGTTGGTYTTTALKFFSYDPETGKRTHFEDNMDKAIRENLPVEYKGTNALLVETTAEEAVKSEALRNFNPDFVISLNLFDMNRWKSQAKFPFEEILRTFEELSGKDTKIYVHPWIDFGSVLTPRHLARIKERMHFEERRTSFDGSPRADRGTTFRLRRK